MVFSSKSSEQAMKRIKRKVNYVFTSVDYDTFELRWLAEVCLRLFGESRLAEAFQNGLDPHTDVAAKILGISYEEALAGLKSADQELKKRVKNARDCAKVANFGLPGGLGIDSLITFARKSYKVTLTREAAVKLKEDWLRALPEMRKYFNWKSQQIGLGNARIKAVISGMERGNVGYCDGCNYDFQNPAAWAAKKALFNVAWECYVDKGTPLYGSRPVVFIHDEIIAEVPEKTAHAASFRLAEVMCQTAGAESKVVPITASPALMKRWYKGAEAVYNSDKQLVPWSPDETSKK